MMQLLGKKKGMTQIFDEEGNQIPVTVIQAGPCVVTQTKSLESDKYAAVQLGFEAIPEKRIGQWPKATVGHFKKKSLKPQRYLQEFRIDGAVYEVGQIL